MVDEQQESFWVDGLTKRKADRLSRIFSLAGFSDICQTQCTVCRRWTVSVGGDVLRACKLLAYGYGNPFAMQTIREIRKRRKRRNWVKRHSGSTPNKKRDKNGRGK